MYFIRLFAFLENLSLTYSEPGSQEEWAKDPRLVPDFHLPLHRWLEIMNVTEGELHD